MDDYSLSSLTESKNEWCARLVSILSHSVIIGIRSVFDEAVKLCSDNDEENKYLMTFQNLLSQIPQWNPTTIEIERKRIETESGCKYLEEIITCVHIIQLKALTCIRVGQKQKKINIDVPSIDKFIHNVYLNVARKLYTNVYLYEKNILPLQLQKNNRDLELLIKDAILSTIRENIPVEQILKVYMEETEEHEMFTSSNNKSGETTAGTQNVPSVTTTSDDKTDVKAEAIPEGKTDVNSIIKNKEDVSKTLADLGIKIEKQDASATQESTPTSDNETTTLTSLNEVVVNTEPVKKQEINFSNIDSAVDVNGKVESIVAPKDLETLKQKAEIAQNSSFNTGDDESIKIGDDVELELETITL